MAHSFRLVLGEIFIDIFNDKMSTTDEGKEELQDMKTTMDSGMKNENQKDAEASAGARQRTYTEKGQQYNEEQIDKFYTSMKTKCTKIIKSIMER